MKVVFLRKKFPFDAILRLHGAFKNITPRINGKGVHYVSLEKPFCSKTEITSL